MELRIPISGTQNFRDIGGYLGADGRRVKRGLLFRSDQLSKLDDAGIAALKALGIRTIIDFRSPPERAASPNRDFGAQTIVCNPSAETAELSASFAAGGDEDRVLVEQLCARQDLGSAEEGILSQYRTFVTAPRSIEAFRSFMQALAQPDCAPMVFHCRGGKDRTGFAALLILGALGVSEEDIIDDFVKTRLNRAARTQEKLARYRAYTDRADVLDYLAALLDAAPHFIEASIQEIARSSGSISAYLTDILGMTQEQLEGMKQLYLEESRNEL